MNILPCLVLCVAFASCLSNESAGTTVDADSGVLCNDTLHEYLSRHKNFDWALYRSYEALEDFLTKWVMRDLDALIECAAKGQDKSIIFVGIDGLVHLTGYEYLCCCCFYVTKIQWIKRAQQQGNYSKVGIMRRILVLDGYVRSLAAFNARWLELLKENMKKCATEILPELEALLAKVLGVLKRLEQSHWAVARACMHRYGEHEKPLEVEVVGSHPDYAAAFSRFMVSYTCGKQKLEVGKAYSTEVLRKNFLAKFEECVVVLDEKFQEGLEKIEPGTPLELPEDPNGKERGAILLMILKGTAKRFESTAAKTAAKESASAIEGVKDLVAESVMKHQVGEDATGQALKGKIKTKLQEKKDAEKEAEKEKKEMVKYTGGISDKRIREMEDFVVLHDNFDSEPRKMTYKQVQELFASQVWLKLGIDKGNALLIHPPHGTAGWKSPMCNAVFGLCQDKWESFKSQKNYADVLAAIKKHKEEAEEYM